MEGKRCSTYEYAYCSSNILIQYVLTKCKVLPSRKQSLVHCVLSYGKKTKQKQNGITTIILECVWPENEATWTSELGVISL